ncbi:MAG: PAS domain-containing protein [Hyphomonadaceae bacterium]
MSAVASSSNTEITFGFDELFFSRTDTAGIIKYGNDVFQRISGYAWDELLEKPHKLIRHADMPRAVFWLLWDTIKRREPIGAFVKNRARCGRYYWVFAIVTPIDGGYLSVRLRPSSSILDVVKREYAALAETEHQQRLSPADSARLLLARLPELGFSDYSEFMATALNAELAARDVELSRCRDLTIGSFNRLMDTAKSLLVDANRISEAYDANASVPFNFRVLAAQLGQAGAAIGVIAANYTALSNEMTTVLTDFIANAQRVSHAINEGAFMAATARVQRELLAFFNNEDNACPLPREPEMVLLDEQQRTYRARASESLRSIAKQVDRFQQACSEMSRLTAGLDVTRIMGKVECSRHVGVKDRLDELLGDLEEFQRTVVGTLKDIERMNHAVHAETVGLISLADAA